MIKNITHLNWNNLADCIPGLVTALMIPFTFSIADGFGAGIICYVILKIGCKQIKDLNPVLLILAVIFIAYFIFTAHT